MKSLSFIGCQEHGFVSLTAPNLSQRLYKWDPCYRCSLKKGLGGLSAKNTSAGVLLSVILGFISLFMNGGGKKLSSQKKKKKNQILRIVNG